MGAGILMSRTQANAAMQAAIARNRDCGGKCPPTQGGVTGQTPATGPRPTGGPNPRQDELHPRTPAGQIARQTGNNPCGGNQNASSNIRPNGYTSNPNTIPVNPRQLSSQPTTPYEQNPLELPTGQPGGQPATDGMGLPTNASQNSDCPPCDGAINPDSKAADDYDQGYQAGMSYGASGMAERGPVSQADIPGSTPAFIQGFNEAAGGLPSRFGRRRQFAGNYNVRVGRGRSNVRRGVARYF